MKDVVINAKNFLIMKKILLMTVKWIINAKNHAIIAIKNVR